MSRETGFLLAIAGCRFRIVVDDASLCRILRGAFAGFVAARGKAEVTVEVSLEERFGANPYVKSIPHNLDIQEIDGLLMVCGSIFSATIDPEAARAQLSISRTSYGFYLFMRFLMMTVLMQRDGMMVHASTVVRGGKAYLFMGEPKSGKSSITKVGTVQKVLCDDCSIIRRCGDGWRAYPSPFWGSMTARGENAEDSYPLAKCFLLHQCDEDYVRPFQRLQQKIVSLHKNVLMFPRLIAGNERLFSLEYDLMKRVPMYKLYFTLTDTVWRCIDHEGTDL